MKLVPEFEHIEILQFGSGFYVQTIGCIVGGAHATKLLAAKSLLLKLNAMQAEAWDYVKYLEDNDSD